MNISKSIRAIAVSALGFTLLVLPAAAQQLTKIDFSGETVGAEPKSLVAVVGIWRIESEGGKNVLAVDGRQWKEGQSSAGVAVPSFSIGFRPMLTTPTRSPKTSKISEAVRSPCVSKDYRAASIRVPAYCSI